MNRGHRLFPLDTIVTCRNANVLTRLPMDSDPLCQTSMNPKTLILVL